VELQHENLQNRLNDLKNYVLRGFNDVYTDGGIINDDVVFVIS
jgi:hypothetical protein